MVLLGTVRIVGRAAAGFQVAMELVHASEPYNPVTVLAWLLQHTNEESVRRRWLFFMPGRELILRMRTLRDASSFDR